MVHALLAAGASTDLLDREYRPLAVDDHGTTPLVWAEHGRQPETAQILRSVTGSSR